MENTVIKIPINSFTFFNILKVVSYSLPEELNKYLYLSKRIQIGLVAQEQEQSRSQTHQPVQQLELQRRHSAIKLGSIRASLLTAL